MGPSRDRSRGSWTGFPGSSGGSLVLLDSFPQQYVARKQTNANIDRQTNITRRSMCGSQRHRQKLKGNGPLRYVLSQRPVVPQQQHVCVCVVCARPGSGSELLAVNRVSEQASAHSGATGGKWQYPCRAKEPGVCVVCVCRLCCVCRVSSSVCFLFLHGSHMLCVYMCVCVCAGEPACACLRGGPVA